MSNSCSYSGQLGVFDTPGGGPGGGGLHRDTGHPGGAQPSSQTGQPAVRYRTAAHPIVWSSVSDPHTFYMDPDPGIFFSNTDPDPGKKTHFLKGL